jgi:molybdopterin-containing oxidoreductase family iron-sulfur binding subunit
MPELDRRDFLRLVGLGAGAAAVAGCSDPVEKLVPYVIQPETITPGIAVYYASTCRECPTACGIHVKTREGRPVKLEGNPNHPINQGKLCAKGQAGIGRTYHPDRYEGPMARSADGKLVPITWEEADAKLAERLQASASKTWVLGSDRGPTLNGIIDRFVSGLGAAGRIVYEPFAHDGLRAATSLVFGRAVLPVFDLSNADLILDFGSDFLDGGLSTIEMSRQFADAQDVKKHPDGGARLVTIGPRLSMTGSNADQWLASAAGAESVVALTLAAAVYAQRKARGDLIPGDVAAIESALRGIDPRSAASQLDVDATAFEKVLARVLAAKSVVALPPSVAATGPQATATAAAVLLLNSLLGAVGTALTLPVEETALPAANLDTLRKLTEDMRLGRVDVLLVHDSNPVYSMPGGLGFGEALEKVGFVVSFASMVDETSARADLVLPDLTSLESWGDAEPRKGVRSLVQPTVRPLKDGRALGDTLLTVGRAAGAQGLPEGTTHDVLKTNWSGTGWRQALDRGGEFGSTPTTSASVGAAVSDLSAGVPALEGPGEYTLVAHAHPLLSDGRGAALPWLQEIPDPVTKASWKSWAEISSETARRLGVGFGEVIRIETSVGAVELPAYPRGGGVRDDVVAVAIGQGHTEGHYASMINDGAPGVARGVNILSVLPAISDEAGARAFLATKATLTATGGFSRIPLSQWTDNQRGRNLIPEVSLAALSDGHAESGGLHGGGGHHDAPPFEYEMKNDGDPDSEYRWGMSIDNDRCTGCSACVAACYIENNVPVVGQDGAIRHREMSWIRIERYIGDGDRTGGTERRPHPDSEQLGVVDVRQAPMLCQHCGAAPCEAVCPVIATYHTDEGINGMVYNRCVGTRYCANNCTYKVRRFNYFDYSRENWPGLLGLMLNPDVTVRGQGVMEKCTFCIQRIEGARQTAKDEKRPIADGEVQTACQQACPTSAITFGNAKDPGSAVVAKSVDPKRSYHSLQVLNTRPAITYLAQVRRDGDDEAGERSHG